MSPPAIDVDICATFIADSRDLFYLVYKFNQQKYFLYMIDLDACNSNEGELIDISRMNKLYGIKREKLSYSEENVKHK